MGEGNEHRGAADQSESKSAASSLGETAEVEGLPVPEADGVVSELERERVFEALFEASTDATRLGRYVVSGTLGRGGMGTVLKAVDLTLDRRVALKVLHRELDEKHATRLLREAKALAKLSHPNVVQVYEIGECEGQTFVAMELVKGRTLRDWMRQSARPSWRRCVEVFSQVGAGLCAAHDRGLVHRDFKPGNAIIDRDGRVRVLDFGLARRVEGVGDDPTTVRRARTSAVESVPLEISLTCPGAVLGTPAYMPPEQMQGWEADARSDQFSFCASLYEAVYGERPFEGTSMAALLMAIAYGKVRPAPKGSKVPARLRKILVRGLAMEASQRWPSMRALLVELRALVRPRGRRWRAIASMGLSMLAGAQLQSREMASVWSPTEVVGHHLDDDAVVRQARAVLAESRTLRLLGDHDGAADAIDRAEVILGTIQRPAIRAEFLEARGLLYAAQGKFSDAESAYQEVLAITEGAKDEPALDTTGGGCGG